MADNKVLILSEDEHVLLKGLIPIIIKDTEKKIKEDKNIINRKALKISVDVLEKFLNKLNKIKF